MNKIIIRLTLIIGLLLVNGACAQSPEGTSREAFEGYRTFPDDQADMQAVIETCMGLPRPISGR